MEMGDDCDVPRVTCQGACQEAGHVVDEVGKDHFDNILREFGDWRRMRDGWLLGALVEQLVDFGEGSVPNLVNEKFRCCGNVSTTEQQKRRMRGGVGGTC